MSTVKGWLMGPHLKAELSPIPTTISIPSWFANNRTEYPLFFQNYCRGSLQVIQVEVNADYCIKTYGYCWWLQWITGLIRSIILMQTLRNSLISCCISLSLREINNLQCLIYLPLSHLYIYYCLVLQKKHG